MFDIGLAYTLQPMGLYQLHDPFEACPRLACAAYLAYPSGMEVLRVNQVGQFIWKRRTVYVSGSLAYEQVGLLEVDNRVWDLYFKDLRLGRIDCPSH